MISRPELLERDDEDVARAAEDERKQGCNGRVQEHRDGSVPEVNVINLFLSKSRFPRNTKNEYNML